MMIGRLEVFAHHDTKTATITKHYNDSIKKGFTLNEEEIYQLEFIVQRLKREFKMNGGAGCEWIKRINGSGYDRQAVSPMDIG